MHSVLRKTGVELDIVSNTLVSLEAGSYNFDTMTGGHPHSVPLSGAKLRSLDETILALNDPAKSEAEFFDRLVARCGVLVPHNICFVSGTCRDRNGPAMFFGPHAEWAADTASVFFRHVDDHPTFLRHCRSPAPIVNEISSHMSRQNWRSTGLYDEVYKPACSEDEIFAKHPFMENHLLNLVITRDGWGFTSEESAALGLLMPHVAQAWNTHTLVRCLKAAAGRNERRSRGGSSFLAVVDQFGCVIEVTNRDALKKFWEQFRISGRDSAARLPETVCRWLRTTLERHFRGGETTLRGLLSCDLQSPSGDRYHVRLLPGSRLGQHIVVFERRETPDDAGAWKLEDLGLSPRRAQVLYWVAQGKCNGEIAAILGISVNTVKNHLRTIYDFLSLENRHAASVAAWRVLRGEESDP